MQDPSERRRVQLGALVVSLLTASHVAYYFPRVVDDLFISLRYAENFAHGHGIVYNVGERVEGYSSPLWFLLQALGFAVGLEGVTWTKVLALLSLAALQTGLYRLGRTWLGLRPLTALLPCLLVALDSYVINWTLLGLETPIYLALLVWFAVTLPAYLDAPERRSRWTAGACTVALALARPEAPLYIAGIALADLARATDRGDLVRRLRAGVRLAVPVGGVLLGLLLARRAYFGLWLPHTYYVKGESAGFDLGKLEPLYAQGIAPAEAVLLLGGIALTVLLAVRRRLLVPVVVILACLYFTASVELDWMPSLRHLLPVLVFSGLGWAFAVDSLCRAQRHRRWTQAVAVILAACAGAGAVQLALVDHRLSPADKRAGTWARPKTHEKWQDTLLALRREEPPHVAAMPAFDMGMITQNYRILEASAEPVADSWYVGRDIGKVGFYTDVRVFDTPGLFTPDVVQDERFRRSRLPSADLVRKAFARRPIAAELLDGWAPVVASVPGILDEHAIVDGTPSHPNDLVIRDRPRPPAQEILRRYEASVARLPPWFHIATLYGESVGAAMEKRLRIVRRAVADMVAPAGLPAQGKLEGAGATLGGQVQTLGCQLGPAAVRPGTEVEVACWYRVLAPPDEEYQVFLHFDRPRGTPRFKGDHVVHGGLRPMKSWRPGEVVRDTALVKVPLATEPGSYQLLFGLWKGARRPHVEPAALHDGAHRVLGPVLRVGP